ncbi:hypothetical protein, partial [Bradyrhizobium sp. SBR1B]|uniref:hypothetical protein n=1 Tax=Bradyrhizobium sp. SBR1B TaxID=2663836 RepID=UPI0017A4F970
WEYVGNYNGSSGGPYHGTVTQSNNANMVTGTYFRQNGTSIRRVVGSRSADDGAIASIVTLDFSAAVTVSGGTPTLTLSDGGVATYTGGSGTTALTFSCTVASEQKSSLPVTAVNLNGASVKNTFGRIVDLALKGIPQFAPQSGVRAHRD